MLEAVVAGLQLLVWLVLVPFALLEMLAELLCGLVLDALRLTGAARSRLDVVCRVPGDRIVSLTVLTVRGARGGRTAGDGPVRSPVAGAAPLRSVPGSGRRRPLGPRRHSRGAPRQRLADGFVTERARLVTPLGWFARAGLSGVLKCGYPYPERTFSW
ncbi:hypothetical protein AMETH_0795 [Amycolatopsis methanolica 239]|uniref:Uncharacterized protein n=1 Tax=Amycolatopsis methanolica 239 TaxID=1068978 RepID=A0A076MSX4_AMYME|nr:hypothetical protein AMETH_0795 [Amycolatopsis methanolica 239]